MNEKVKQYLNDKIRALTDDVQLYKYVEKDEVQAEITSLELENVNNILGALNNLEELIKSKDEYIAKLCNDRAELKEELKQVEDFKYHYDRYREKLANNLKVINCMQEEETTNRNLIDSLEDRNDRLVERLEKQKTELKELKEFVKVLCKMKIVDSNHKIYGINEKDIELIKKVVEKYGK